MASDGVPAILPASLVTAGQSPAANAAQAPVGNSLPPAGNGGTASSAAAVKSGAEAAANAAPQASSTPARKTATAVNKADLKALVAQLNKYLNDSGRPNEFRVDPESRNQTIQEINPASGAIIGEYSAAEFPGLARSLGVSGMLVDDRA